MGAWRGVAVVLVGAVILAACGAKVPSRRGSDAPSSAVRQASSISASSASIPDASSVPVADLSPAPPGTVEKVVDARLDGKAPGEIAVLSQTPAPAAQPSDPPQMHLNIYGYRGGAWTDIFSAPGTGAFASTLLFAENASFPSTESFSLVGTGSFLGTGGQQLVTRFWSTGADCGASTISVLGMSAGHVVRLASVSGECSLAAQMVGPATVEITGPYYGPAASLCCPTIASANANLTYDVATGKWVLRPPYFSLAQN